MGREIRLQYENAWYHVMNRAAGKKFVFSDENHKHIFFEFLTETYKKHEIEIHAYCLMDNHYHLLVNTPKANLSQAMHYLQFRFAKEYNKIVVSDGPIFKSRYKSILIKNDAYLSQVCRYIHLNPVEANIASGLDYRWSSYHYYLNQSRKPFWLNTDTLLEMISNNKDNLNFIDYHKEDNCEELKEFYKKTHTSKVNSLELKFAGVVCELATFYNLVKDISGDRGPNLSKFIFCFLARNIYCYKITDISNYLGYKNRSSIASLLSRHKPKFSDDLLLNLIGLKRTPDVLIRTLLEHF